MKVKECMDQDHVSVGSQIGNAERKMPPLEKIIVRRANPYEGNSHSNVNISIDPIPEYSASSIKYRVTDDYKPKTQAIADFIGKNKGKRLLEVLEMDLP